MFEFQWGSRHRIQARIYNSAKKYGYLKAHIDNVYTSKTRLWLYIPTILNAFRNRMDQ